MIEIHIMDQNSKSKYPIDKKVWDENGISITELREVFRIQTELKFKITEPSFYSWQKKKEKNNTHKHTMQRSLIILKENITIIKQQISTVIIYTKTQSNSLFPKLSICQCSSSEHNYDSSWNLNQVFTYFIFDIEILNSHVLKH